MQITLSNEARADGRAAVEWYINEGALPSADEFADKLEHTLHLLSRFPKMGAPSPYDTRTLPLHTFPFSLIYRVQSESIRIIAIAHHSRRPEYWAARR